MHEFVSWRSYENFAYAVRYQERFSRGPEVNQFLAAVTASSQKRLVQIEVGTTFWRAQLGCAWIEGEPTDRNYDVPGPYSAERMLPLRHSPSEGRANPVGIPVLYVATVAGTAVAEVRPWVGKLVSVAQFRSRKRLTVLDCSSDKARPFYLGNGEPSSAKREVAVWGHINRAFSEPVSPEDDRASYIPTQVLAEHFRSLGAEGVVYNSSLGDGKNIGLFAVDAVEFVDCTIHAIGSLKLEHKPVSDPNLFRKLRVR